MSLQQLRNCNFGRFKASATGSSGVGYKILDVVGATVTSRTTTGVYETAPGIYAAYMTFPDNFHGQIVWDTGVAFLTASYATEQYNVEENDPKTSLIYGDTQFISSSFMTIESDIMSVGMILNEVSGNVDVIGNQTSYISSSVPIIQTKLDDIKTLAEQLYDIQYGRWHITGNQMIFYKADNTTEVARFNLFDELATPASDSVFQRVKV